MSMNKSTPRVRILADVPVEVKDKLEEICRELGMTKVEFITQQIEEFHKRIFT